MGATEKRAVDELFGLGAEMRVALDARTTKLHAKAWLLERESGLTTAFVGSSNLSHTALFDGLEWNVRLSAGDAAHVIDRVRMMFESHWASEHFSPYDPAVNGDELERALRDHDRRSLGEVSTISFANLDVRPYPHQQRMLEQLTLERERHDRHRNLVVAATGTGKTVVAGLDYRQLVDRAGRDLSLLFVAHREEILRQSLATYRAILRDGDFGQIHGGGRVADGRHVFAMIQSLREQRLERDRRRHLRRRRRGRVPPRRRDDLRSPAQPPQPRRAVRADRYPRAARWPGRHDLVRWPDRSRAAAVGGHR